MFSHFPWDNYILILPRKPGFYEASKIQIVIPLINNSNMRTNDIYPALGDVVEWRKQTSSKDSQ